MERSTVCFPFRMDPPSCFSPPVAILQLLSAHSLARCQSGGAREETLKTGGSNQVRVSQHVGPLATPSYCLAKVGGWLGSSSLANQTSSCHRPA